MSTPTLPVLPSTAQAIENTGVNKVWGQQGAGTPKFWERFSRYIYRNSRATKTPPCALQAKDGMYLLMANTGMDIIFKGRFENASVSEETGAIFAGPITARRAESKRQPIELREGEDPTGLVRQAIMGGLGKWGDHLPLRMFARLLTNGRTDGPGAVKPGPVQNCYDGQPLFSLTHKINPLAKVGPAAGQKANLIKLKGAVDEAAVTSIFTTLRRWPDLDGVSLPNADGEVRPLILCPSDESAIRWAHVLGGPQLSKELLQQALNAAVSSVVVGRAEIMVWPWLVTEAETGLSFDPEKRSIVLSGTGRAPAIYAEENPPVIRNTGPQGQPAHDKAADELYVRAYVEMGVAEYRSVLAIDEP